MTRRILPFVLFLFCTITSMAQELLTLQVHVVDNSTGEELPYVSVYVSSSNNTIANVDGNFTIKAQPDDVVKISYVGYYTQQIKACDMPEVVRMVVAERTLHQLTVMPTEDFLEKVTKTLNKEYNKKFNKKAKYFCRLTTKMGNNDELTEAFLEGCSAANLRDLVMLNGRRGQMTQWGLIRPQLSDVNFQHALELGPIVYATPFWQGSMLPLTENVKMQRKYQSMYFSIRCEYLQDDKEGKILCFDIQPSEEHKVNNMLIGKLYVKASTYQPLRFEGEVLGMTLEVKKRKNRIEVPVKMKVNITYTLRNGFTEVEDLSCDIDGGEYLRTQTIMHNVSDMDIKFSKAQKTQVKENMLSAIDAAGFDKMMWEHAGIIQRTEYEEKLAQQQARIDSTSITQHTGKADLDKLIDRARLFGERIPQEKVFLHLDNTSYFLGDTIWYAAYTRQTNNDLPSTISNVLYVELLNNDGYVMERQVVKMDRGRGHGNFYLNPEFYAGFYELRAYTRWNLNWGQQEREHGDAAKRWFINEDKEHEFFRDYDKLYSRTIPVYDAPTDSTAFYHDMTLRPLRRYFRNEPDKRKMQLTFYPEGGNLVEGVENRVAFEATWDDGEWVEGTLSVDGKEAKTTHRGRGIISVTPTHKYAPKVEFITSKDGEKVKGDWPDAIASGVALHAQQEDDVWHITAHATSDLTPDSLAMVVMHEGMITNIKAFNTRDEHIELYTDRMKPGVHQITVFNNQGAILADRLIFVQPDSIQSRPNLAIEGKKDNYRPFEKITLDVQALSGEASKQPISLAVRDAWNQDHIYDSGNMLTEMLLSSEVKGFIPQPEWFFESNDEEHRQGLDLLMMTQGWRRFSWTDMAVPGQWDLTHPDEKGIVIEGMVNAYMSHQDMLDEERSGMEFDDRDSYADKLQLLGKKVKKEVTVHAELVEGMTLEAIENNMMTTNQRFRLRLPDFYDKSILFLSAADLSKLKAGEKYNWIQTALAMDMLPKTNTYKFEKMAQSPDVMVYLSQPWPRYATPFNWYQNHLAPAPKKANGEAGRRRFSDGTIELNEVSVKAKRNGMRKFSDSEPAFSVDAYEAWNNAMDAGFQPDPEFIVRGYIGDLGLEDPYVTETRVNESGEIEAFRSSGIHIRFGMNIERRTDIMGIDSEKLKEMESMGGQEAIDTLYNRKHLWSMERSLSPGELKYYFKVNQYNQPTDELDIRKLEKFIIYTDYAPRLSGSRRYMGSDLPETKLAVYPYPDAGMRSFYRDRRYIIQGFNIADDFYHPDYSNRELPKDGSKDRRRTLYWNPNLQLDDKGHATVTLYNCGREAEISITAEGMTEEGTILTGKE